MKACYHVRVKQLLIETGKHNSNGIMSFMGIKTKFIDSKEKAVKYINRYYKNYKLSFNES
jgi:hypothetical protein